MEQTAPNGTVTPPDPAPPKQGSVRLAERVAALEAETAALRAELTKLKRIVADLMMSNPQVQQRMQDLLIAQIDQQP